ncbi:branched-chain amino acid ABC transporter substrate-binding protein [Pokkaliibacter plantistimulans]|uniref:Branched-chain amino acid ABC transporter substrate-binding protein n=2 Tax=Pseudomonadota TaxID=1224 RepID=A0ABX5LX57_9GAMM|nr:ABC transporter ATP-binding protein [Pokkaliibacter plantistimulans]PPC75177.1 ABC transporter ATP-binding protein [Pokkaliibacter plantistimulans]PXF31249.1 branched-chain amino acid ABC transporter substrate-binding protein [Pokkaliibacter plantistimulans]
MSTTDTPWALEARGLVKRYGQLVATDHADICVAKGELHALIGPNGAGKTTLIKQLSGEIFSDQGQIRFHGADITRMPIHQRAHRGLVRSYQITSIFEEMSVIDNVALAVQALQGHSFRFWRPAASDARLREPAFRCLERVRLAHRASVLAGNLAHGEKRQLEIAMTLAAEPSMLLLDEPMAGMSPEESGQMVELLQALKGEHSILLVEHDMDAVFSLSDRLTVLVYGKPLVTGTAAEIRNDQRVREAYLGEEAA